MQMPMPCLSRLPLPVEPAVSSVPPELELLVEHLANSSVNAPKSVMALGKDPQLAPIVQFVQQGWPDTCPDPDQLSPFFEKKEEDSLFMKDVCFGELRLSFLPLTKMQCLLSFMKDTQGSHE